MKSILSAIALLLLLGRVATDAATVPIRNAPDRLQQNQKSAGWTYEKQGNGLSKASITATNILQFEYPYSGPSAATLTIRKRNDDTHVYIEVSNGQFNRSFQNGSARIRFDNRPPVTYSLSAAANGRANIIFFDAEQKLIDQIKTARKMTVAVNFQGQGTRQLVFNTAGLRWPG